jgi:hemoglobin
MRVFLVLACWAGVAAFAACGAKKPAASPEDVENEGGADAQAVEAAPPPPPSLYKRLGGRDALAGVVDELLGDVLADKRVAKLFDKDKNKDRAAQLSGRLVEELCVVAGGDDCKYDGKPMKDAHAGMKITQAQWDAFMQDLAIAMKTRGVDDALAKELADAVTAQTHDDIVTGAAKGK